MENIVDLLRLAKERTLKKIIEGQKGQALPIVLILLVLGGLLIAPTLDYVSTSLKTHKQVYETKTLELYAADSGVEDALYWLPQLRENGGSAGPYGNWTRSSYEINDRDVGVTVENVTSETYKITSIAASDSGGRTTIVSYVSVWLLNFSDLLQNAITSNGDVTIKNNVNVTGNVTAAGTVDNKGTVNGTINENAELEWPTAENLSAYYRDDVEDLAPPFPYNHPMDIAGTNTTIGALYRDGPLDIYNSSGTPATLTLNGTVYITGDLKIGTEKQDFTLNLNGQTIFVESASADPQKAIEIGGRCNIIGTGCIIAVGDVYFGPQGDVGTEDDFVVIMSVEGTTTLQPSGTFHGSVIGDVSVEAKSGENATIHWTDPSGRGLNFPMGDDTGAAGISSLSIVSWKIE